MENSDEFSIAFAEWIVVNFYNKSEAYEYDINIEDGEWLVNPFPGIGKEIEIKNTAELLTIFKEQHYGE